MNATAIQLAGRAVGTLASVVTVALTTRTLGIEDYGVLTTAVVFAGLWTSLTELGVGAVIVRRITSGDGELGRLVGLNIGLSLVFCVPLAVVAAAVGLVVYRNEGAVHGPLLVVCAGLAVTTVASCFNPVFLVAVRFTAVAAADVAGRVVSLVATVVVVAMDAGLIWFAVVQIVPPVVQLIVQGLAARRITALRVSFERRPALGLLRESLPQTGVLVIGTLYWRADAVILTLVSSTREVGAYGLAYTVAFTLSVLSSFFLASSLSTMTHRYASDRQAFGRFVSSGIELMLFLGLPLAVVGGVLAHPVIVLLGDRQFASVAALPMTLLLCSVALTFLTGVLSQALFAAHDQAFLLRVNVVTLLANIVLNLALAPAYGAVGSAVALLVTEVAGVVIASMRLVRRTPVGVPWLFLGRLVPSLAVAGAVAFLLRDEWLVLSGAAAVVAYAGVNLAAGPVRVSTVRGLLHGGAEPVTAP